MGGVTVGGHPHRPHLGMLRSPPQRKERDSLKGKKEDERVKNRPGGSGEMEGPNSGDMSGHKGKDGEQVPEDGKSREGIGGSKEGHEGKDIAGKKRIDLGEDVRRSVSEGSGRSGSGFSFTALQPPPSSKQGKSRGAASNQSQVQSGGTTYFYSGQQVGGEG